MLLHFIILSVSRSISICVRACVNVGVHDLPACTASTSILCHVIVLRPHERGPVGDGNGVDDNCYIECTGEMTAMDITSDCATTGCLYFSRISRLVRRK